MKMEVKDIGSLGGGERGKLKENGKQNARDGGGKREMGGGEGIRKGENEEGLMGDK